MTAIKSSPTKRRSQSLSVARTEFVASVNHGIDDLMRRSGYGRERATKTLLRELGRGGQAPSENEIFNMMELQGLGMEDAAKALIVSKAVRRAMKDQGFSAIEAIDDLTAKLCVANLFQSASPEKQQQPLQQRTPLRRAVSSQTMVQASQRKPSARKMVKSKLTKVKADTKTKNPRKRTASGEEKLDAIRTRADSVAEEVNAKIATQQPSDARPPVAPKGKRSTGDVTGAVTAQPASKRPREV
mmetsp:Transcript_4911/g.8096  ORF Transcript_4911/g.8096 Transcript_4911/m.8096 type:complete len:243 (-) Transcript_4911:84-812(-)|eukprot:CAMPEP_0119029484 /NCGR_PEP_ID=MMETSP1176-20130426/40543_1 /TAXON_ID=265551 /ORGANISM="Synedropsis recta cf, Strain CCMP1620" /LENGTH=242 /DNA_ID=CAMNT_0006985831 /DNA_START=734 /DNA_END=1462 /DNA_ORIENTATION=-